MAFSYKKNGDDFDRKTAPRPTLTPERAWEKIKPYCSYQERCHQEVKDKLYDFGLHQQDVETMLSRLIEENYLNEERFAIQYAGGHFRIKKWGKIKIRAGLKQKGVSDYCIKKALQEVAEDDYMKTLEKLATAKWDSLRSKQYLARQAKTRDYMLQKGFESNLVWAVVKSFVKK